MEKAMHAKEVISKRLERYPKLLEMEKNTGVDKFFIFVAASTLLMLLLYTIGGASLLIKLVGVVYPTYKSLHSSGSARSEKEKPWLAYWIIYSLMTFTDPMTDYLFSGTPLYILAKMGFLVWCYHPNTMGAQVIYQSLLKPHVSPLCKNVETEKSK